MLAQINPETGTGRYAVWAYPLRQTGKFGLPALLSEHDRLNPARDAAKRGCASDAGTPTNVVEVRDPDGRVRVRYWHLSAPESTWSRAERRLVSREVLRPRVFMGSISRNMEERVSDADVAAAAASVVAVRRARTHAADCECVACLQRHP